MKSLKIGTILLIICFVCTLSLLGVYMLTKQNINENYKNEMNITLAKLVPEANEFEDVTDNYDISGDTLVGEIFIAKENDNKICTVIITYPKGYAGPVQVLTAINSNGKILAVEVGSNKETKGIGTKVMETSYLLQFNEKDASTVLEANLDIDTISGATISSETVIDGVNEATDFYLKNIV